MITARDGVAFVGRERVLRGDHKVVTIGFEEFAEEGLTLALVVFIGGVEEVAASFCEPIEDPPKFVF
jgi:hypothetical protein